MEKLYTLSKLLKALNLSKEAKTISTLNKNSGAIPAGMHRYILQRGRFGGSEYDSLNYEEDGSGESEDSHKEKQKDLS